MGYMAEGILDGTFDQYTGEYQGHNNPRINNNIKKKWAKQIQCRHCNKWICIEGIAQHNEAKHNNLNKKE